MRIFVKWKSLKILISLFIIDSSQSMFTSVIKHFISEPQKRAFIKINTINTNTEDLVTFVGSRKGYIHFPATDKHITEHVWSFTYTGKKTASFVVAVAHKGTNNSQHTLGKLEIRLDAFKSNFITNHTFTLRPSDRNSSPIEVNLSVHLNEDGSKVFTGPQSNIISDDFEILQSHNNSRELYL